MNHVAWLLRALQEPCWIAERVLLTFVALNFYGPRPNPPPLPVAQGPESPLAADVSGYILRTQPPGGIVALKLPELTESVVRPAEKGTGVVHTLAGPDREGWIAYVHKDSAAEYPPGAHRLTMSNLDGRDQRVLFEWPGEALASAKIGGSMALSQRGTRIAFVSGLRGEQMRQPDAYIQVGTIEVWTPDGPVPPPTPIEALDFGLAWFPDGGKLVYVGWASRADVAAVQDEILRSFGEWERVPAVFIWDAETDTRRLLHVGWHVRVSPDGEAALAGDFSRRAWRRIDLASGASTPVSWPAMLHPPAALLHDDLVIYIGLPAEGAPPRYTQAYSPVRGPRPLGALRLGRINGSESQTLLYPADERHIMSYGVVRIAP